MIQLQTRNFQIFIWSFRKHSNEIIPRSCLSYPWRGTTSHFRPLWRVVFTNRFHYILLLLRPRGMAMSSHSIHMNSLAPRECDSVFKHGEVIKWKHFPRYWSFVRRIQRPPVNSPHKGQWRGALMISLICVWINDWNKQSWGWWFETLSRSLWRHRIELIRSALSHRCPSFL